MPRQSGLLVLLFECRDQRLRPAGVNLALPPIGTQPLQLPGAEIAFALLQFTVFMRKNLLLLIVRLFARHLL